jgi:hypothetical protein
VISKDPNYNLIAAIACLFLLYLGPSQCQRAEVAEQRTSDLVKHLERAIQKNDWDLVKEIVENFSTPGDSDKNYEVDNHGWHSTD